MEWIGSARSPDRTRPIKQTAVHGISIPASLPIPDRSTFGLPALSESRRPVPKASTPKSRARTMWNRSAFRGESFPVFYGVL